MIKETKQLYVAPGDIIEVNFTLKKSPIIVKVINVIPRYGNYNERTTKTTSLIKGKLITPIKCESFFHENTGYCYDCKNTGIITEENFDIRFVTKILEKSKSQSYQKYNCYKRDDRYIYQEDKKTLSGNFLTILMYIISQMDIEINRPLRSDVTNIYWKTRLGFISGKKYNNHYIEITVKKKLFKKWVHKNLNRIFLTSKETSKIETLRYMEEERKYWEDYEIEIQR